MWTIFPKTTEVKKNSMAYLRGRKALGCICKCTAKKHVGADEAKLMSTNSQSTIDVSLNVC
jgi:hypothetical protein